MQLWEYRLKVKSGFLTPWQADIIFGHLAWAYLESFGEEPFHQWLQRFVKDPPFILSDGWQTGRFPRPFFPAKRLPAASKEEKMKQIKLGKAVKKMKTIHDSDFLRFIQGHPMLLTDAGGTPWKTVNRIHNSISRDSGRTMDSGGLFEVEATYLQEDEHVSLFVRVSDEQSLQEFDMLLHLVSRTGFGGKRNVGYGSFHVEGRWPRPELEAVENANAVVWLSHGVPHANDPLDGWYKLETKYGKLGGSFASQGFPFKRPLTRITPGAVFLDQVPKPYYGQMVGGISPRHPQVMQYGYALAIPVYLPEAEQLLQHSMHSPFIK